MVKCLLGLNRISDVATATRALAHVDAERIERVRQLRQVVVIQRLRTISL